MTYPIFCPNNHLVLDAAFCPMCNWERPEAGDMGKPLWSPIYIGANLGGPGRGIIARPAVINNIAVFPTEDAKLIGIDLTGGEEKWNASLGQGLMARAIVPFGDDILVPISDERNLGEAECASLAMVDPERGTISTIWNSVSHQISMPAISENLIIVRTGTSEIIALSGEQPLNVVWRKPLNSWWALPPQVSGNNLIVVDGRPMHGQGKLITFSISNGEQIWQVATNGMISRPLAVNHDIVVFINGKNQLKGISIQNGQPLWQHEYSRVYSPPIANSNSIVLVVRGEKPFGEPGHYMLTALNPSDGSVQWETDLPVNARGRVVTVLENNIIIGCDTGGIYSFNSINGSPKWDYQLGSEEDPIRTELISDNGLLIAGSSAGKIVALRMNEPTKELKNPEYYLEIGDYESAATIYGLSGHLLKAAKIYEEYLGSPTRALAIYENEKLFQLAGNLASSLNMRKEAQEFYEKAGNMIAVAEEKLRNEDRLGAAETYEECGELLKAAELYEKAKDYRKSIEIYKTLDNGPKVEELLKNVPPKADDIHYLEKAGKYKEAGDIAFQIELYDRASKLFQIAEEERLEVEALNKFLENNTQDWAFERLANLSRSSGDFITEASSWERIEGRQANAAEAYLRAAVQAEKTTHIIDLKSEGKISSLYKKAYSLFKYLGNIDQKNECYQKYIYHGRLPLVKVEGKAEKTFHEGEWNSLLLTVENIGRGTANNISVRAWGEQFIFDQSSSWIQESLGPKIPINIELDVRHNPDKGSGKVPLHINWSWKDISGIEYKDEVTLRVSVRRQEETTKDISPAEIHYHGNVYQAGGDIELQKGDRVEIKRGERLRLSSEEMVQNDHIKIPELLCSNCHLPINPGAKECSGCQKRLCPKCGHIVEDDAVFCTNCQEKVS